jgi:type VI secretion system protein ImpC
VRITIAQLAKVEILQDLAAGTDLDDSGLAELLLHPHRVAGSERPALIVGDYEFTPNLDDLAVLERLGTIACRLRAPVVSAAGPAILGVDSFPQVAGIRNFAEVFARHSYEPWLLLRRTAAAHWIALALPRLLCRLPYGKATSPAETFDFEERPGTEHEKLLWGNPAFGVAAALAAMFEDDGWEMDPASAIPRLTDLPLYGYELDGETVTKPCAEALLSETTVQALAAQGLLPLVSYRDADIVALPSLQAIAEPRTALRFS